MKLRLIGPPDTVHGWAALLKRAFGVVGREYPTRGNGNEVRYYVDIDDRLAANIGADSPSQVSNVLSEGKQGGVGDDPA